jgi:glycosyltransferase involved in cell wall biosynthesis
LPTNALTFLYTRSGTACLTLLEAVSLGLPVIASDSGGVSELISNGVTGFIVSPFDNIDGYVDTLKKIHQDRSVLHGIAGKALKLLKSKHSW